MRNYLIYITIYRGITKIPIDAIISNLPLFSSL
nr:MAG TPA: hypothetical protein [Bacteriophage sp.]